MSANSKQKIKPTFIYLSSDLNSPIESIEIEKLKNEGKVIAITQKTVPCNSLNIKIIKLKPKIPNLILILWLKIATLFSKTLNCKNEINFPKRNIYTKPTFFRIFINTIWRLKSSRLINQRLPFFENLFFSPIIKFQKIILKPRKVKNYMICVSDCLISRNLNLIPILCYFKLNKIKIVGIVKSWDNPFSCQFTRSCDCFLVWSSSIVNDLKKIQKISKIKYKLWGPVQFLPFIEKMERSRYK